MPSFGWFFGSAFVEPSSFQPSNLRASGVCTDASSRALALPCAAVGPCAGAVRCAAVAGSIVVGRAPLPLTVVFRLIAVTSRLARGLTGLADRPRREDGVVEEVETIEMLGTQGVKRA